MMEALDASENKTKKARIDEVIDKATTAEQKPPNKTMKLKGADNTPAAMGMVNFGELRASEHRTAMTEEL